MDCLVIDEHKRGQGIGKKLMDAANNYAQAQDCLYADLLTLKKRKKMLPTLFMHNLDFLRTQKSIIFLKRLC